MEKVITKHRALKVTDNLSKRRGFPDNKLIKSSRLFESSGKGVYIEENRDLYLTDKDGVAFGFSFCRGQE